MDHKRPRGLFITGTDTGVGKTYVACLIARALRAAGHRVGVYKPATSGCRRDGDTLVSDDAVSLWEAAGRPGTLDEVCPQRFAAPLAPHLAALAEGRTINADQLRSGADAWRGRCDVLLVEGAGGLMSPLGEHDYNATLAEDLGLPLVVVARNALGTINHTLQTLIAAAAWNKGLPVAGIVLNRAQNSADDPSVESNRRELNERAMAPVLAEVLHGAKEFDAIVDWYALESQ
ncbi:MAG: dethiobiotin synthase [Planctomycetia bacterium]|nr:dethiobiotin synthase [Planctomycetia bacterium]